MSEPNQKPIQKVKRHQLPKDRRIDNVPSQTGIIDYIKARTNGLKDCVDVILDVMNGEKLPGLDNVPGYFYRLDCAKYLIERVSGKVPMTMKDPDGEDYDIHQILLVHLQKQKDKPGVFDVPAEEVIDIPEEGK